MTQSPARYVPSYSVVRSAIISASAALAVTFAVHVVKGGLPDDREAPGSVVAWVVFAITAVIAAPVVETLMLAAAFASTKRRLGAVGASYLAAFVLVLFHSAFSPLWGIILPSPSSCSRSRFAWSRRAIP